MDCITPPEVNVVAEGTARRTMLAEALPLLVTYASGATVELSPWQVDVSTARGSEMSRFAAELMSRHEIACARRLLPVLEEIRRRPSRTVSFERSESRGGIRGRLDTSRYLARRAGGMSVARPYPVVTAQYTPDTSENALVRLCIRGLSFSLRHSPFPTGSAESVAARREQGRMLHLLKQSPWKAVTRTGQLARLRSEVDARVRRRQTGNEAAYRRLLQWVAEWQLDVAHLDYQSREAVVAGILVFPASELFWDRVFEVWCLGQLYRSLERIGLSAVQAHRPLFDRTKGPVASYGGTARVEVRFQTQSPLGSPRWSYRGGGSLTGIPDIVLSSPGRPLLLLDAKNRPVDLQAPRMSEEIYKMLGYAENFRGPVTVPFRAILLFPGNGSMHRTLDGPDGNRLDVIVTDLQRERAVTEGSLDEVLRSWLESRPG